MAKILIIEDDQALSNLYTTMLTTYGHHVLQTQSGSEGYMLALQENPDLILLDHRLPDATGLEILKKLSQVSSTAKIPVIVITNFAGDLNREQIGSYGVKDVLLKYEITLTDLLEKVKNNLKSHSIKQEVETKDNG